MSVLIAPKDINEFVNLYGNVKVYKKDKTFYTENFASYCVGMIKDSITSSTYNVEGLCRPIDLAYPSMSSNGDNVIVVHWEKSNALPRTIFKTIVHIVYKMPTSDNMEVGYVLNLNMTDLENMRSISFDNLSITEYRKAIIELVKARKKPDSNVILTI